MMAWIDNSKDMCRVFKNPEYRKTRGNQAGNFGGMAYEYAWKVFGKYNSHILYPEMLFSIRLGERFLHLVEPFVNRRGDLTVDVTEIVGYASGIVYEHDGVEETIISTKRLIAAEKAVLMGEGKLYLRADYSAVSRLYTEQYGWVDPNAKARLDLSHTNLPPAGSHTGEPYPSVQALFWDKTDAWAYRDFLTQALSQTPKSFCHEGGERFTYSPYFFSEV